MNGNGASMNPFTGAIRWNSTADYSRNASFGLVWFGLVWFSGFAIRRMMISDGWNPRFAVVSFYLNLASDLFQLFVYLCFFAIGPQISPASSELDPENPGPVYHPPLLLCVCFFAIFHQKLSKLCDSTRYTPQWFFCLCSFAMGPLWPPIPKP
jgi:hypothetical protein